MVADVWMGRMWQLKAVALDCNCGSSVLLGSPWPWGVVLGDGSDQGDTGVQENSQPVGFLPQFLVVWDFSGLGFAAAPPLLRLVPLRACPAPGRAAGGSSGWAEL